MSFNLTFASFEHAIAKGAKYAVTGLSDLFSFANKAQVLEPEVSALAGALAGPQAAAISDLAFHTFGATVGALKNVAVDANSATTSVTFQLATQTVNDIKSAGAQIEAVIKAVGGKVPAKQ